MKEEKQNNKGFTLVEVMVVLVIILVVGTMIVGVFFAVARNANKAKSLDVVKKNGNYAIEQMSRSIRYGRTFDGVSTDGVTYQKNCIVPIASNPSQSQSRSIASSQTSSGFFSSLIDLIPKFNEIKQNASSFTTKLLAGIFSNSSMGLFQTGSKQIPQGQVAGTSIVTFDVQSSDGRLDAWLPDACTLSPITTNAQVGQTTSKAYRGFLSFDTSSIPPDATVSLATLKIYKRADVSDTEFDIVARYRDWGSGDFGSGVDCSDWDSNPTSTVAGTYNTSSYVAGYNSISLSNTSGINISGITYFSLASDREENNIRPRGNEFVNFYTFEQGSAFFPKLEVTYNTPDPTSTPTSTPTPTVTPTPGPTPTPVQYKYVKVTDSSGEQFTYSCISNEDVKLDSSLNEGIKSKDSLGIETELVDTSSVQIDTCSITCRQSNLASPPTVTINFELSSRTTSTLPENKTSIPFQTSVTTRNF